MAQVAQNSGCANTFSRVEYNRRIHYLSPDDNSSRHMLGLGLLLNPIVECDYMQYIHELSLVLVDSLHLYIEQRFWQDFYPVVLFDVGGDRALVC